LRRTAISGLIANPRRTSPRFLGLQGRLSAEKSFAGGTAQVQLQPQINDELPAVRLHRGRGNR